jgi:hypothetical protein
MIIEKVLADLRWPINFLESLRRTEFLVIITDFNAGLIL